MSIELSPVLNQTYPPSSYGLLLELHRGKRCRYRIHDRSKRNLVIGTGSVLLPILNEVESVIFHSELSCVGSVVVLCGCSVILRCCLCPYITRSTLSSGALVVRAYTAEPTQVAYYESPSHIRRRPPIPIVPSPNPAPKRMAISTSPFRLQSARGDIDIFRPIRIGVREPRRLRLSLPPALRLVRPCAP